MQKGDEARGKITLFAVGEIAKKTDGVRNCIPIETGRRKKEMGRWGKKCNLGILKYA